MVLRTVRILSAMLVCLGMLYILTGCGSPVSRNDYVVADRVFEAAHPPPIPRHRLSGKSYVVKGKRYHILAEADGYTETGDATWYGPGFHNRKTASGERFDTHDFTAAHKTLPLGSIVRVTNLENNRQVIVRINDRGPFGRGRIIDLSYAAGKALKIIQPGFAEVRIQTLPDSFLAGLKQLDTDDPAWIPTTLASLADEPLRYPTTRSYLRADDIRSLLLVRLEPSAPQKTFAAASPFGQRLLTAFRSTNKFWAYLSEIGESGKHVRIEAPSSEELLGVAHREMGTVRNHRSGELRLVRR